MEYRCCPGAGGIVVALTLMNTGGGAGRLACAWWRFAYRYGIATAVPFTTSLNQITY